jgi:hypothetical protein
MSLMLSFTFEIFNEILSPIGPKKFYNVVVQDKLDSIVASTTSNVRSFQH